ncbi:MAG: proton-conducting transporter membrane subunit, partial [Betaproteobacteria bacterium]
MALVLVADDAYLFMVAWESMALASYFLVVTDHKVAEIRGAGFLYLLQAHVGAGAILLAFGALQAGAGQYTFEAMRGAARGPGGAGLAFMQALLGFGAKAGFLPLHAWLPEAHPAAPSPVSALMSGVMLKTAVYGLLRVGLDLAGEPAAWCSWAARESQAWCRRAMPDPGNAGPWRRWPRRASCWDCFRCRCCAPSSPWPRCW